MNILFVLNSGSPGGMEQHVLDLVEAVTSNGHKAFVWCNDGVIANWYKEAGAKVQIEYIRTDIDPFYIFKLYKFLRINKIHVIHGHELKAGCNALVASFLAGTKVRITNVHTPISEWQAKSWIKKFIHRLEAKYYAQMVNFFSTVEIALTSSRKRIKQSEGIAENKLVVIPNGIDVNKYLITTENVQYLRAVTRRKYHISDDAFILGLVSRVTIEKGHAILVKAFSELLKTNAPYVSKLHLLLAGGGVLEDQVTHQINELGIQAKVTITGVFSSEESIGLYKSIDYFVFPSLAEGFGYVLIEAMANALPILSSDLDVLKEVAGDTVNYFKAGNTNDLLVSLADELSKPEVLNEHFNSRALNRVKELYTKESFKNSYISLYSRLLGEVK